MKRRSQMSANVYIEKKWKKNSRNVKTSEAHDYFNYSIDS